MMNWEKIIKTALQPTPRRDTPRLRDVALSRMPDISGWRVDKPGAREEMAGGGTGKATYTGQTESGQPLQVSLDKGRGQWIASAGGMELEAPVQGDVLDAGHVQNVLSFAMRQMDEEIAESKKQQQPRGRPQAPKIPMFAEGRAGDIRNVAARVAESIIARGNGHTDLGNEVGSWPGGWLNGEWKCPKCGTMIGKNLKGESPHGLVNQHQCKSTAGR